MCLNCISEMNQAFAFVQKCERSEKTLRSLLDQPTPIIVEINELPPATNQYPNERVEKSVVCVSNTVDCQTKLVDGHSYQCSDCCVEFKTKLEFERHLCDKQLELTAIEPIEYIQTVESQSQAPHSICNSKKTSMTEVVNDFIAETTMKFICSDCNATFSSRRSLSLHVNSRKCIQKAYECDICHKVFIRKRYLVRHLQRMHQMMNEIDKVKCGDGSKPSQRKRSYKCHLCLKGKLRNFKKNQRRKYCLIIQF